MDYFESAEGLVISKQRAIKEIKDHNALNEIDDFYLNYNTLCHLNNIQFSKWLMSVIKKEDRFDFLYEAGYKCHHIIFKM